MPSPFLDDLGVESEGDQGVGFAKVVEVDPFDSSRRQCQFESSAEVGVIQPVFFGTQEEW